MSAAIRIPSLYFIATTEDPVTYGYLRVKTKISAKNYAKTRLNIIPPMSTAIRISSLYLIVTIEDPVTYGYLRVKTKIRAKKYVFKSKIKLFSSKYSIVVINTLSKQPIPSSHEKFELIV